MHLDRAPQSKPKLETKSLPQLAQDAVMGAVNLLPKAQYDIQMREASEGEDAGKRDISDGRSGHAVDVVGIRVSDEVPILAVQVTIATDSVVREKKKQEARDIPWTRRIEGLPTEELAVPRAVVQLDGGLVEAFAKDLDIQKHPNLIKQIFDRLILNMDYAKVKTENPDEKNAAEALKKKFTDFRQSMQ